MMAAQRLSPPVLLLAVLCLLPIRAAAEGSGSAPLLQRIADAGAGVRTIRCRFVQEKRLAMFTKPLVSRGELSLAKPDRLRWEVLEPEVSGFSLAGAAGRRWVGGRIEPFDVRRDPMMGLVAAQLLAWASADMGALARDYAIEVAGERPATLRLRPAGGNQGPVDHLLVRFSDDLTHVALVEVHERDGDVTRIAFSSATINVDLPRDLF